MDGSIHQRGMPEHTRKVRKVLRDLLQVAMSDLGDPARRDRRNPIVHLLEHEAVQIREVARHVKGRDLPPSIERMVVAAREAIEDETAVRRGAALGHDGLMRTKDRRPGGDPLENLLFLVRERTMPFKSTDQGIRHSLPFSGWGTFQC